DLRSITVARPKVPNPDWGRLAGRRLAPGTLPSRGEPSSSGPALVATTECWISPCSVRPLLSRAKRPFQRNLKPPRELAKPARMQAPLEMARPGIEPGHHDFQKAARTRG